MNNKNVSFNLTKNWQDEEFTVRIDFHSRPGTRTFYWATLTYKQCIIYSLLYSRARSTLQAMVLTASCCSVYNKVFVKNSYKVNTPFNFSKSFLILFFYRKVVIVYFKYGNCDLLQLQFVHLTKQGIAHWSLLPLFK